MNQDISDFKLPTLKKLIIIGKIHEIIKYDYDQKTLTIKNFDEFKFLEKKSKNLFREIQLTTETLISDLKIKSLETLKIINCKILSFNFLEEGFKNCPIKNLKISRCEIILLKFIQKFS
jgi:hypothetical protein